MRSGKRMKEMIALVAIVSFWGVWSWGLGYLYDKYLESKD